MSHRKGSSDICITLLKFLADSWNAHASGKTPGAQIEIIVGRKSRKEILADPHWKEDKVWSLSSTKLEELWWHLGFSTEIPERFQDWVFLKTNGETTTDLEITQMSIYKLTAKHIAVYSNNRIQHSIRNEVPTDTSNIMNFLNTMLN